MEMASEWGIPPWEIDGGDPLEWYIRYKVRREIVVKVQESQKSDG